MTRKPLIAANWKMYKSPREAAEYFRTFLPLLADHSRDEVAFFPPAPALPVAVEASRKKFGVGAQNMHWLDEGAYTGEISAPMLRDMGCTHVLIGHSERRQHFGETDEQVHLKLAQALKHSLIPVVCVGESDAEREHGHTEDVLIRQVNAAIGKLSAHQCATLVIAYEPIWAIGTGKVATPRIAAEAHLTIRDEAARLLGRQFADGLRILYGGSVKPDNVDALMNEPEIDGALVGGASLDPNGFSRIVRYAAS